MHKTGVKGMGKVVRKRGLDVGFFLVIDVFGVLSTVALNCLFQKIRVQ